MRAQLQVLLKESGAFILATLKKFTDGVRSTSLCDVKDGLLYKKLREKLNWSDITVSFSSDGSPVFMSSVCSMWPIQMLVNELPVLQRWKNIIVGGIWFGQNHPNMPMFLEQFVEEVW